MDEIAQADDPIIRQNMPLNEAKAIFESRKDADKLRLLTIRQEDYLSVYELRGYVDYFFGYMAASTGCIKWFDLLPYGDGFALMYPIREKLGEMPSYVDSPKMAEVFRQTSEWLELIGIEDVGQLNEALGKGRAREIVLVNEALHERHIASIGATIAERHHQGVRVVLIAGPSSSGKTTFAKRLAIQLMTHGLKPFTLFC
jgi:uridine kinase